MCAVVSDADARRAGAVAPFKIVRHARRLLACGERVFFSLFRSVQCSQSDFAARRPLSPRGLRLEKRRGGNGISPPPLPPCLARKQTLLCNGAQPPAVLTPGPLRCYDTDHVRCRPPLKVAEFVATAGMLGPQIRWSSPCWRAHL